MSDTPLLSAAQKRALKSRAQTLESTVRVGHAGITTGLLESLHTALACHELVKVRFSGSKDERKTIAPDLAAQTGSVLVQVVGNVAVFFRPRAATSSRPDHAESFTA
jgi:RNA-binding protein